MLLIHPPNTLVLNAATTTNSIFSSTPTKLVLVLHTSTTIHFQLFLFTKLTNKRLHISAKPKTRDPKSAMAEKMTEKGGAAVVQRVEDDHDDSGRITSMRTAETLFRLLPMGLCVAALTVMLKNSETNDFGSLSYTDLGAFKFLVHANGICAGYSLLSAVVTAVPRPSTMSRAWTFFFLDQVLTYIILGAGAVSTEVVYLAYKGDQAITWSAACGTFGGFCHKATASVALTFAVMLCYAALSLISSYRLFSRFDPPTTHPSNKGTTEMADFYN